MPGDRVLVTGSAGHLGEALVRVLRAGGRDVVGLDLLASPFTTTVGSIADRATVRGCLAGVGAVLHPATLHKPHVGSHSRQDFVDTNITGTLTLLQEAVAAGVGSFVFTSTTSAFGRALTPSPGAPAAWITEEVTPVPRNIYGVTKTAAEDLCALVHADHGLPVVILRTSRFFPEPDDVDAVRSAYPDANIKANEFLYRRADIAGRGGRPPARARPRARDRFRALHRQRDNAVQPRRPAPRCGPTRPRWYAACSPTSEAEYARRGWRMFGHIDRVYVNERARAELGWTPVYDFRRVLDLLKADEDPRSPLARSGRRQGISPALHRPVHGSLGRQRGEEGRMSLTSSSGVSSAATL